MLTYFALYGFEPWAVLSRRQRRFVRRHCIQFMLTYPPVMLVRFLVTAVALMTVSLAFHGHWQQFVAFFLVIYGLNELIDTIVVVRRRQEIGSYIHENSAEIQTVA